MMRKLHRMFSKAFRTIMYLIFSIKALVLTLSSYWLRNGGKIDNSTNFERNILTSSNFEKMRYIIVLNDPKNHAVELS